MKVYLVWDHDPAYMTSVLDKVFLDGKAADKYVREMNEQSHIEKSEWAIFRQPWFTIQVRETDDE